MKYNNVSHKAPKKINAGGLPPPTKDQKKLFRKLSDQIGCAVCFFYCRHEDGSRVEGSVAQIHHKLSGSKRISHWHVIPLCKMHHDEGRPGNPSFHSIMGKYGKAEFEETFATEAELIIKCEEWINQPYVSGLLEHEETENSYNRDSNTDANDQPNDGDERHKVEQMQAFDTPVHLRVIHYRARLCDPDNLNAKGVIDAIVKAGILSDDSAKEVTSVTHSQVKVSSYSEEKTRVEIEESLNG